MKKIIGILFILFISINVNALTFCENDYDTILRIHGNEHDLIINTRDCKAINETTFCTFNNSYYYCDLYATQGIFPEELIASIDVIGSNIHIERLSSDYLIKLNGEIITVSDLEKKRK